MTNIVIIFDDVINEESLFSAAELAYGKDAKILAPLNKKTFIENEWTYGVVAEFIFCGSNDINSVLFCVLLILNDLHGVHHIISEDGTKVERRFNSLGECIPDSLHEICDRMPKALNDIYESNKICEDLISKLNYFTSVISQAKGKELELLLGKSNKKIPFFNNKPKSTALGLLGIDEFKELNIHYESLERRHGLNSMAYFSRKINGIKKYYANSFNKKGGCVEVASFPVAYKYLSIFLFLSACETIKTRNYTASYILFFRSFEVYCEGLLLSKKIAKIDKHRDSYGSVFNDIFLILKDQTYIKPMGFGVKWAVIRENKLTNKMPRNLLSKIKLHKELRNISIFTHGDMVVSFDILMELKNCVIECIEYFEKESYQKVFNWSDVKLDMESHFIYDFKTHVGNMVFKTYNTTTLNFSI